MTTLETILLKYKIPKYKLIKTMGNDYKDNQYTMWYDKISGKRLISDQDLKKMRLALMLLGVTEAFKSQVEQVEKTLERII